MNCSITDWLLILTVGLYRDFFFIFYFFRSKLRMCEQESPCSLDFADAQDLCILFQNIPLHLSRSTQLPTRPDEIVFLSPSL